MLGSYIRAARPLRGFVSSLPTLTQQSLGFDTNLLNSGIRGLRTKPVRELPVPKHERRLDVVIFGKPNSGKSVLLNTLVKEKLAAISRKKHTTRGEIVGVYNHRNVQLAFFDTPGFVSIKETNQSDVQTLGKIATSTLHGADVVLLVVDSSSRLTDNVKDTFAEMAKYAFKHAKTEVILVLNKVDLVEPKKRLLDITYELVSLINGVKLPPDQAQNAALDTTTFMISALENDGVDDIKNYLMTLSKPREWLVPKNKGSTTLEMKDRAREAVLEALMDNTHQEVPYISDIYCRNISELAAKSYKSSSNGPKVVGKLKRRFDVSIVVESPSQQRIVVGEKARTLLSIRQAASSILEEMFKDCTVLLYLHIEVAGKEKKNDELLEPFEDGEIIMYNSEDDRDEIEDSSSLSSVKTIRGVSATEFDDLEESLKKTKDDSFDEDEDERKFQEYVKSINMEEFIKNNVISTNLEDPDSPSPNLSILNSSGLDNVVQSSQSSFSTTSSTSERSSRGKIPPRVKRSASLPVKDSEEPKESLSKSETVSKLLKEDLKQAGSTSKSESAIKSLKDGLKPSKSENVDRADLIRDSLKTAVDAASVNKKSYGSTERNTTNKRSSSSSNSNNSSNRDSNKDRSNSDSNRNSNRGFINSDHGFDSNNKKKDNKVGGNSFNDRGSNGNGYRSSSSNNSKRE